MPAAKSSDLQILQAKLHVPHFPCPNARLSASALNRRMTGHPLLAAVMAPQRLGQFLLVHLQPHRLLWTRAAGRLCAMADSTLAKPVKILPCLACHRQGRKTGLLQLAIYQICQTGAVIDSLFEAPCKTIPFARRLLSYHSAAVTQIPPSGQTHLQVRRNRAIGGEDKPDHFALWAGFVG